MRGRVSCYINFEGLGKNITIKIIIKKSSNCLLLLSSNSEENLEILQKHGLKIYLLTFEIAIRSQVNNVAEFILQQKFLTFY